MAFHVLIVEDDPALAEVMAFTLESDECTVQCVDSVEAALREADSRLPHLIILDIMLPKLSGFDVVARLRHDERFSKLPIIVHTSSDLKSEELEALKLGEIRYVRKTSMEISALPELVEQMIRSTIV